MSLVGIGRVISDCLIACSSLLSLNFRFSCYSMSACEVCKLKTTRGNGSLECSGCKIVVHERCLNLPPATITAFAQGTSKYKCSKCKAARRVSLSSEAPTIVSVHKKLEDLSETVNQRFEDLLKELREENGMLRKRMIELEEKNLHYERRIDVLEKRVSALSLDADNRMQLENLASVEIQNVPNDMLKENNVEVAAEVFSDALDIDINHSEIKDVHLIKMGPDKQRNMLIVKLSSEQVKAKIITARREKNKANDYKGIFLKESHQSGARIFINERLTPRRRELLTVARDWRRKLNFKFVWVDGGLIKMRRGEGERVFTINSLSDFEKLKQVK